MEKKFEYVYTETVEKRVTPEDIYGAEVVSAMIDKYKDEIVDFRPLRMGDFFVPREFKFTQATRAEVMGEYVLRFAGKDSPRFILRPQVKLLREYVVKVWDEPPKAGERYMDNEDYRLNHFCVCDRSPQSPTKEDGYFIGDKRVTVEEVTK